MLFSVWVSYGHIKSSTLMLFSLYVSYSHTKPPTLMFFPDV